MRLFFLLLLFISFSANSQDSLFNSSQIPGTHYNEPNKPVELGVQFSISNDGAFTSFKWYASVGGTYTANIYKGTDKIFTQQFEASSRGWVSVPIFVMADAGEYTASVFAANGRYGSRNNVFANPITVGNISTQRGAGKFIYANQSSFPTDVYRNSSYYVDVVFQELIATPEQWTKNVADTLTLSVDTCGQKPFVDYKLSAYGPDTLSYKWREIGDSTFSSAFKEQNITFYDEGQRMFLCEGKDSKGNIRSTTQILITISGNPKDVVIELLRDGTYRVKGTNIIWKHPYTMITDF